MLSESRFFENAVFQQTVDTLAVKKCFNDGVDFLGSYTDYRDVSIYGSSYCAKDLGIVLLAEIDKQEVEEPIGSFTRENTSNRNSHNPRNGTCCVYCIKITFKTSNKIKKRRKQNFKW